MEQQAEKILPSRLSKAMRKRRAIPLLGFLRRKIGPIAVLLACDDGQLIEGKIQELNEAHVNISHLVGQQTKKRKKKREVRNN